MYDQVIFYNEFGFGDVFESREFVKECASIIPAKKYYYAHGKPEKILLDLGDIKTKEFTRFMDPMRGIWDDLNGNLYINTWIGRDSKYVLPGIGCTPEKLFLMYNDMLSVYNLGKLTKNIIDYIPEIDFSKCVRGGVDKFLAQTSGIRKVFIDNGNVRSNQADNFNFSPIISEVSNQHLDTVFILTHKNSEVSHKGNVVFLDEVVGIEDFNLYELSYLSTYCDVLIGRNSGPHVFTQNRQNCADKSKILLSFTYKYSGSSFVVNTDVAIKKMWSDATDFSGVTNKILEVLG